MEGDALCPSLPISFATTHMSTISFLFRNSQIDSFNSLAMHSSFSFCLSVLASVYLSFLPSVRWCQPPAFFHSFSLSANFFRVLRHFEFFWQFKETLCWRKEKNEKKKERTSHLSFFLYVYFYLFLEKKSFGSLKCFINFFLTRNNVLFCPGLNWK